MTDVSRRNRVLVAFAIFVFALILRLVGVGWGLKNEFHNQSYHPDEPIIFLYAQQIEPAKFQFTPKSQVPHFYSYGTLYLTLLRVAADMTAVYTGAPDLKNADSFWSYVSRVHVAGRLLSAFAGAGTAVAVFFIMWRVAGLVGAIASALLIAVAPGHIIHSAFQTVDVLALFFLALGTVVALRFADSDNAPDDRTGLKLAALSGVLFGLSAGTKYTGILGLLTLMTVLCLMKRPKALVEAVVGVAAALAAFAITTPGMILDSSHFMEDFSYEMQHTAAGHGLVFTGTSSGFLFHIGNLFVGIGILLTLLGIGGLIYASVKKQVWAFAVLAFFLPYYLLIGRAEVKFLRYTFPMYVGIACGFGWLMAEGQRKKGMGRMVVVGGILALGGIDTGGMTGAARALFWTARTDPRDEAAAFIKHASSDQTVAGLASDPWTWSVPLFKDSTAPRSMPFEARMAEMSQTIHPRVIFHFPVAESKPNPGPFPFDVRLLTSDKPEFVPITSLEVNPIQHLVGLRNLPGDAQFSVDRFQEFMAQLDKDYEVVKVYGSPAPTVEDIQYVQPQVVVWQKKKR